MGIVAKYKFDGSVYADLIPKFNEEFTNYTVTDEVEGNIIIRTIESDSLPTQIYFGLHNSVNVATDREASLLSIEYLDVSQCTNLAQLCRYCYNLESVNCGDWDTRNVDSMLWLFEGCNKLKEVDVRNWDTSKCTQIGAIFSGCTSLASIDLSLWDTSKVTNLMYLFASCSSLTTIDISNMIISEGNSLEGFITSVCTSLKYIKCNIPNTISKISLLLPTRTSDNPGVIIYQGAETLPQDTITALNSKGWNVVTNPTLIAKYKYDSTIYKNLIPTFNVGYMGFIEDEEVDANGVVTRMIEHVELPKDILFGERNWDSRTLKSRSLLKVTYLNLSNVTNCDRMFRWCDSLIEVNSSDWDTSKVTTMHYMFTDCARLGLLDVSDWNTSNVTTMRGMFNSCYALTSLDLSNFNTSNVTNMNQMFNNCSNLTSLDVSNFDTSNVTNMSSMFNNTPRLKDIGMIYCDKSTINKVASLLPTDHNITIWVESDDILQYDQYDHITYKTQKVQDTVHLNSPLLMGDTIEVIDGKTYHVHRYEKVVLDGSEDWLYNSNQTTEKTLRFSLPITNGKLETGGIQCDFFPTDASVTLTMDYELEGITKYRENGNLYLRIFKSRLSTLDVAGLKQWLKANPTTVIYKLATPYYELISEEPLELTLLDTTDNTINNNSILPSNMTIANKELSTIAIKPSTTYTLAFDKSNKYSEIIIDICGGEQVTTFSNMVQLTTPSELGSGIRFISSDGCIISNVRLIEGGLVESAIPKETFEGLQSSFDEGYIIGENIAPAIGSANWIASSTMNGKVTENSIILNKVNGSINTDVYTSSEFNIKENTNYTVIINIIKNNYITSFNVNGYGGDLFTKSIFQMKEGFTGLLIYHKTTVNSFTNISSARSLQFYGAGSGYEDASVEIGGIYILEGDHTHLSEAELMRYIEKGTSHYDEEDFNHVGKYKVEYKVTGKNKFDMSTTVTKNHNGITYNIQDDKLIMSGTINGDTYLYFNLSSLKKHMKRGKTYKLSWVCSEFIPFKLFGSANGDIYAAACDLSKELTGTRKITLTTSDFVGLRVECLPNESLGVTLNNVTLQIQIEEGTVTTSYEPYKEDIKTYYLSSPLLEGDTIEDINGVATHVKRYGKVVFDGSEDEKWWDTSEYGSKNNNTIEFRGGNINAVKDGVSFCDRFRANRVNLWSIDTECSGLVEGYDFDIRILKTKLLTPDTEGFKQWLSENPTTVVYQLASPIYEPISTESILCDSYVSGHLDFDSAIPVEKVEFKRLAIPLKYQSNSTNYIVKFDSDNNGVINEVFFGGSNNPALKNVIISKGINILNMATGNGTIANSIHFNGIGFNASNIQVVANALDDNGEVKEFDYFKGLKSSFESELVTDENDENYGKYKVECRIVGKNKFDGEVSSIYNDIFTFNNANGLLTANDKTTDTRPWSFNNAQYHIKLHKGTYTITCKTVTPSTSIHSQIILYTTNKTIASFPVNEVNTIGTYSRKFTLNEDIMIGIEGKFYDGAYYIQIEEGTKATSYEPYKESIHTLYLNSPLLKGDKLVVHEGKLCHYHKMGMVVLDGSEELIFHKTDIENISYYFYSMRDIENIQGSLDVPMISDKLIDLQDYSKTTNTNYTMYSNGSSIIFHINNDVKTIELAKQWLSENPTTVVYELVSPYYEEIEPQVSQYSLSSVKDGDMEIITGLPIEIDLTYRTDINGVSSIEEQIANVQNRANLIDIINTEVDE